uniref:dUTP diphosphatase n=1 Tax=viral metagenome TaxID=1070528 RepID=A0A6C0KUP8_9ZZZZ
MSTPKILVKKIAPEAVMPTKASPSDIGYDLTIVSRETLLTGTWHGRIMDPEVLLYDTGISVEPDSGYYVEVVPRSSLSRTGYIMANSIGIIDPNYRGTIKVALVKIDKYAPDIPLPFKGFQLIVRKNEAVELVCTESELSNTARGNGGFGSTNSANQQQQRRRRPQDIRNDPTASAMPILFQMGEQIE